MRPLPHPRLPKSDRRAALALLAGVLLSALVIADPAITEGAAADASVRKAATLAGYLSYGVMTLTVVWGVRTPTGIDKRAVRRQSLYMSHMGLAIATLAFGVMHAITYVFQTKEHFSYLKVVVPFVQGGEMRSPQGSSAWS